MTDEVDDPQIAAFNGWAKANDACELPNLILPSDDVTISECASKLFGYIAPNMRLFVRGGAVMRLVTREDGLLALEVLNPNAARSLIEKFCRPFAWRSGANRERVLKPTICSHDHAQALLNSEEAFKILPHVSGLLNCPVLTNIGKELVVVGRGYDESTKLLITGGENVPEVPLENAVVDLLSLVDEFDFQTTSDKSRAVASFITPALKSGGFLKRPVPADVAEADASQSGKTFRQKLTVAMYNERLSLISNRTGGVGSVDESLNQALVSGKPFIQYDNFRGKLDTAHLEAFMTAEGSFSCRVPYRGEIYVQPDKFFIFLSSNGVDTTRDFANRSNIIRIKKKPPGFAYTQFEEGDLLDRVQHWQSYYLGCVFSVIRQWHRQGMQRTGETRHDFREWVQVVDWIVQNIFKLAPVMDGHQNAQERVSNPQMVWLRQLVLTIHNTGETGRQLTATDLQRICESADIAIPGLRSEADELKASRVIGTIMGKLFGTRNELDFEGFAVVRGEKSVLRPNTLAGGGYQVKFYEVKQA
ncbi:MAG TPA: hypothetical protein VG347_04860 [Verrucomicrobiae bacterium]|nr:hypothetical protein [Verrucomicrobiae bacterium]